LEEPRPERDRLKPEDLPAQANELRRDVDKLDHPYVFEGVFQGHLAQRREVAGVLGAKVPRNAKCSRSGWWLHPFDGSVTKIGV
jgi:hypothetical protein